MRSHSLVAVAASAVVALTLVSCASSEPGPAASTEPASAARASVETPAGVTIEMPAEPQAALGFYTTDPDILVTLGFTLNRTQPVRDDFESFPDFFPLDQLEGIETFHNFPEHNYEAVAAADPDFILNGLGYDPEIDPRLQEIAPTYTYNAFDGADWRDAVSQTATDLGRDAQWQVWTEEYEARVADIRARLDEAGVDPVVAALDSYGDGVLAAYGGVPWLVFADLGLRTADVVGSDEQGLIPDDGVTISPENVGQLGDVDIIFVGADERGSTTFDDDEALAANELWQNFPAVKNDAIYPYNCEMQYGSPSGQDAFLTVVEKALLG